MNTTENRLGKLRRAKQIVADVDDALGEQAASDVGRIRSDLQSAGQTLRSAGFTRHMEDAMGRAAGIAIAHGFDDLADRATRVLDDEIDLGAEPLDEVERETDERGRVTLGSRWADQRVRVAVLGSEDVDDA